MDDFFAYSDKTVSVLFDGRAVCLILSFQTGFINCLRFSEDGTEVVCAVGQEHKTGRWWTNREAKNIVATISINYSQCT